MNVHIIILALAIVGIGESLYLNYERKRKCPPICVIGHSCAEVWESPRSKTFGVSNEILGIIFYATALVVEWSLYRGETSFSVVTGEYLILIAGSLMSCYFIYLQWRVIRAWCFWCTLSAIIAWVMILARLVL